MIIKTNKSKVALAVLPMLFTSLSVTAAPVLEEIVVTAQKRAQNLNDVGASVDAFSSDSIATLGLSQPSDIAAYSPGVYIKPTVGDQNPVITIRGVGFNDFTSIQSPGAGVYVDQVVVPYHPMMTFQLLDLDRVEVLKGPQGTLYGRNSTAGAINFVSQKPSQEFSAQVSLDYSSWETTDLEMAVGGSLTEDLSARLAIAKYDRSDSYQKNRANSSDNIGEKDRLAYRLSFLFEQEGFDALLNIHGGQDESGQTALEHLASRDATTLAEPCAPVAAGNRSEGACVNAGGYSDADNDPYAGDYSVDGGGVDNDAFGIGLTMNWDLSDSLTLTSVTGYDEYERNQFQDIDASPFVFLDVTFTDDTEAFSQELRLTSQGEDINWIVGLYYSDDTVEALQAIDVSDLAGAPGSVANITNNQDSESYAIFGNVDVRLSDQLTLVAGLRYTDEEKSWNGGSDAPALGVVDNLSNLKLSDSDISGKLGLEFRPNEEHLIYGHISKGYRAGGFPGGFATLPEALQAFDQENVFAYEVGYKGTFAEGALQLNTSVYYYDWQDMQTQFSEERGGLTSLFLTNAGDADITGLEVQLDWAVTESFSLSGGVNIMDTELSSSDERLDGKELANSPDLTYNVRAVYIVPVESYDLTFSADVSHASDRFFTSDNEPVFSGDDYTLANLRVGLGSQEGDWELAIWGRNLLDEEYRTEGFNQFGSAGSSYHAYGEPASYGVSVSKGF